MLPSGVQGLAEGAPEGELSDDAGVLAKWHWIIRRFNAELAEAHPDMEPIEVKP